MQQGSIRRQVPLDSFRSELQAFHADWPDWQARNRLQVNIALDRRMGEEEFRIRSEDGIQITAGSKAGVAWALETLGQQGDITSKTIDIHDKPSYAFRAVLVDVARRYHSPSTLRQIVRWCHAAKVRFLQLHLTDDQNWMLPTKVLAGVDRNNSHGRPAYTVEEIKALEDFAMARGVSLIPEIDIPGHSSLLTRFNPEVFSIKGSPSSGCVNFGSPAVRDVLRSLIAELAVTFSGSRYIHIGGDEAWYPDAEKDPAFAKTMAGLGASASPQDVFVDFVADMAKVVLKTRKTPIVWEGFGRTPFAKAHIPPETVVVAWEGAYYPAKALVEDGYQIVNAGWDPNYVVNHYPYDSYTLVPLPNLFQVNPNVFGIVDWTPGKEHAVALPKSERLSGSMMCWWEGHEWNAQTTLPLRILAFGDRLWEGDTAGAYMDFLRKSQATVQRIHDHTVPFKVIVEGATPGNRLHFTNKATISARASDPAVRIGMRSDGRIPTASDVRPNLEVSASAVVTLQAFKGDVPLGETEFLSLKKVTVIPNLALGARVTASTPVDPQFPPSLVTDGVADDEGAFWLGYPNPCALTIDLGALKTVGCVEVVPFWAAHLPTQYIVDVSADGKAWQQVVDQSRQSEPPTVAGYVNRFPPQKVRYVRVRITGSQQFPPSMARIHEIRVMGE